MQILDEVFRHEEGRRADGAQRPDARPAKRVETCSDIHKRSGEQRGMLSNVTTGGELEGSISVLHGTLKYKAFFGQMTFSSLPKKARVLLSKNNKIFCAFSTLKKYFLSGRTVNLRFNRGLFKSKN